MAAPRSSRRGEGSRAETSARSSRASPRRGTPSAASSQTWSSGVARASTARAAACSRASRGAPFTTAPLLALLSTITTSALGAWPGAPRAGTVGPAAASTMRMMSAVRSSSSSQFWSLSRR
jgi:hypothetical protein